MKINDKNDIDSILSEEIFKFMTKIVSIIHKSTSHDSNKARLHLYKVCNYLIYDLFNLLLDLSLLTMKDGCSREEAISSNKKLMEVTIDHAIEQAINNMK